MPNPIIARETLLFLLLNNWPSEDYAASSQNLYFYLLNWCSVRSEVKYTFMHFAKIFFWIHKRRVSSFDVLPFCSVGCLGKVDERRLAKNESLVSFHRVAKQAKLEMTLLNFKLIKEHLISYAHFRVLKQWEIYDTKEKEKKEIKRKEKPHIKKQDYMYIYIYYYNNLSPL